MGIDYNSYLCFGIKIEDDKLDNLLNEQSILLDIDLKLIYAGSEYTENGKITFVCIAKSVIKSDLYYDYKSPIKYDRLVAKPEWKERLIQWAAENDCFKPKIGWWLLIDEC